jgi:hypothetical protein
MLQVSLYNFFLFFNNFFWRLYFLCVTMWFLCGYTLTFSLIFFNVGYNLKSIFLKGTPDSNVYRCLNLNPERSTYSMTLELNSKSISFLFLSTSEEFLKTTVFRLGNMTVSTSVRVD